ncbi:MAG: extracellular solute-binding protein [Solirubrobacteraceae bacterium]
MSSLLLGALALSALTAGCGGTGPKDSILLYNGQHPQLTRALVNAFERQSGIDVRVRTGDGIVLADQLLQEGKGSPADVYLTENSPELVTLDQHGLLTKVARSTLGRVPDRYNAPSGNWVAVARRVSALAYDPKLISASALPTSILQLAKPSWKGKVALAPTDSDFAPLVGAIIATYGEKNAADWLAGLKRNGQLYQSDEAVVAGLNRGDVATGIVNNYYWYRLRLELGAANMHSALYYFPNRDVGSILNISGAAVLAGAAHPGNAKRFLSFLVSKPAQEIVAHGDDYEYPVRPGVPPNSELPALSTIAPATLSPVKLGNDQPAARLIQESGLA